MYGEIGSVFRHALVYGAASLTTSLIGFLMIPVYTRYLSPADYGVLELLQLASNVISIIMAIGFSGAVLRFYFQHDSEDDRREVVSTATFYTMYSRTPRGRHIIRMCESPPCHLVGAENLVKAVAEHLGVEVGGTTLDSIHLSQAGHDKLAQAIYKFIRGGLVSGK